MTRNTQASLRISKDLKKRICEIAEHEDRTFSNAMELLLELAVDRYHEVGSLRRAAAPRSKKISAIDERLADRIATQVVDKLRRAS